MSEKILTQKQPSKDYRNRRDENLNVSEEREVLPDDYQKMLDNNPAFQAFITKHNMPEIF